ncbi:MAG TPA: transmembrane domain-containing protein, partial [Ilumatobacteraceae bacterium]|nr:transmembrane domain-containing protein [Ilumatobacteraceae bacterium]
EIAVGEALDADTIYHELSHAWINRRLTTERWFTEGLPQVYAAELVRRDGDEERTPTEPAADDPAARPLTDWTAADDERAVEEYGYATSFWVLDGLVDEIGLDRTRDVVAALGSGSSPYGATSDVERPDFDWKRVYDVLVEVGGATTAGDVFRSHVVGEADAPIIERRDRAAADVAALAERSAPWELPVGVRNRLERWEIDDVTEAVVAADVVLEQRTELESIEDAVGVDEPDAADVAYASAPMRSTGGVDFGEVTAVLDAAIALGEQLDEQLQGITMVAPEAGVSPPELSDIEGVTDFATGIAATDGQLEAMVRIIELDDQLDAASGFFVTIGRWGSDIERDLDAARAQVERADSDAALEILDSAEVRIDDLAAAGRLRLAVAGALLVVAIGVLVIFWRRRRRASLEAQD